MRYVFHTMMACIFSATVMAGEAPAPSPAPDANAGDKKPAIKWEKWSDEVFARARKEEKFVLLDLEAVWCHWCHVMEENTYSDPAVIDYFQKKYIAVKVDQDSRPDISNRYEEYGWPATVIFDKDGKEIVKRSGYIPPKPMVRLLQACIDDPTPGPSVTEEPALKFSTDGALPADLLKEMQEALTIRYDKDQKGWHFSHKYLDWENTEYCLNRAAGGDKELETMAREALDAQLNLIDPVWGGVYQYSTGGRWDEPHFEKIMEFQAANLRAYALGYAQFKDPKHLAAAKSIRSFVNTFLRSPDGAYYVSMDADLVQGEHSAEYFKLDDAGRRKLGIPRIDKHVYSRENGWVIAALAWLYAATGDKQCLDDASKAAAWIIEHRSLEGGVGFRHDEKDAAGPYLGDNEAMARAFLELFTATADRAWLKRAEETMQFIGKTFTDGDTPGYVSSKPAESASPVRPMPNRDESASLCRTANLLHHYTGKAEYRKIAERAFQFLTDKNMALRNPLGAVLNAERELSSEPRHITIVGAKDNAAAAELFQAALKLAGSYQRLDWYDAKEGAPLRDDVAYPQMPEPAAYVCAEGRCSAPVKRPLELLTMVERMAKKK
jgi:uncharacterized protein YyaL (SSP411 family)